ncbi:MoaD/ThiS family protein [Orrella marina]|uniref:Molybdopterin converting factor subunit 1 n=1 Tax=Orrella marina TaxID=2163011 RepID=A0A2R4XJZ3_9BURK|nr:MoaD/ThiS family protein [Orrella marina]AWB34093.1 molybdopterin converting factor subunit 1 [Orrella marina]
MSVTILYFGELREQISLANETMDIATDHLTVDGLLSKLIEKGDPWSSALASDEPLRIAINQEMARRDAEIPANAEVALFRPVTGG